MNHLVLTCMCGHKMRVPASALGTMGLCAECDEQILVTQDNTESLEESPLTIDISSTSTEGLCAKCGREFRGAWDQHETAQGVLCHICANLAVGDGPKPAEESPQTRPQIVPPDMPLDPVEPYGKVTPKSDGGIRILGYHIDPESEVFKRWIYVAAALLITVTLYYVFTSGTTTVETTPVADEPVEFPLWITPVLWAWGAVKIYLRIFLAIYIVLKWTQSLPHDSPMLDIVHIGAAALFLSGVYLATGFFTQLIGVLPMAGSIFALLLQVVYILLTFNVLYGWYNLKAYDILLYCVTYFAMGIIMNVAGIAVYGTLGLLFA